MSKNKKNKKKNKNKDKESENDKVCLTPDELADMGLDDETLNQLSNARTTVENAYRQAEEDECDEECQQEKSLYQLYQDRLASLNCAQNLRTIERQLGNSPLPTTGGDDLPDITYLKNIFTNLKSSIGGQQTVYNQFDTYQEQIDNILVSTRNQFKELNDKLNSKDATYEVNYRKSYYETVEIDKIVYGQNIVIVIYFILLAAYSLFMLFAKEKYKDFKFYIYIIALFLLPYYIVPILVNIFFSIQDYVNLLMETKGPKNTYMNL